MRRRITIAMLGVVLGTLVLTVTGGLLLVRRAATSTAEGEVATQARSLAQLLSTRAANADQTALRVLKQVGSFQYVGVAGLSASGALEGLPSPLTTGAANTAMDTAPLQEGRMISGTVGRTVFAAVPTNLGRRERALVGLPQGDVPVLVVTRGVSNPVNGLPYFVFVAGAVLLVGSGVAALLARRLDAPLSRAVGATRRMAAGDLAARVQVGDHDAPELAELGRAVNSLGESLGRSRGLERQFLLSVSHELRTPLTSIRGYADALAEGATDDVGGAAAVIGSESRRLDRLVQDLLDLARLDARQFSLHLQRVDAVAIAEGVAEGFRPEAANLGLALVTAVEPGTEVWVDADPDRLAQMVANLVENAFKFAARRVEVGAATSGTSCVLWVADDGPGIAQEDLARVFDRHFRSERLRARRVGSGLGLAIVAELANAMGARVAAESPLPGRGGTRMCVWMAARTAPPPPPLSSPAVSSPESGQVTSGSSRAAAETGAPSPAAAPPGRNATSQGGATSR